MPKKTKYKHFEMPEDPDDLESELGIIAPQARAKGLLLYQVKEELDKESDRGCVLVAAAYLESEIVSLLLAMFVKQSANSNASLFEFNGPVGTFSSRIKIAYALGLISDPVCDDIEIIRGLRNDFAHLHERMDFGVPDVMSRVGQLALTKDGNFDNPRKRFIGNVAMLAASLHLSTELTHHRDVPCYVPIGYASNIEDYELDIAAHRIKATTAPTITLEQAKDMARHMRGWWSKQEQADTSLPVSSEAQFEMPKTE